MKKSNKIKIVEQKPLKPLSAIFADKSRDKYKEETVGDYETKLSRMNFLELQNHAISLGVKPSTERIMLTKHLLNEFQRNKGEITRLFGDQKKSKKKQRTKNPFRNHPRWRQVLISAVGRAKLLTKWSCPASQPDQLCLGLRIT